jgi:hypothetical protein
MHLIPTPIVLQPLLPSTFLEYVLARYTSPTTILICQTRASFLSSLCQAVTSGDYTAYLADRRQDTDRDPDRCAEIQENDEPVSEVSEKEGHHGSDKRCQLLIPTLHQIAISRNIRMVFLPTLSHLRAYLPTCEIPGAKSYKDTRQDEFNDNSGSGGSIFEKAVDKGRPSFVVFGMISLHRDTSEWSVQGLSASLSSLIDIGARNDVRVVICEKAEDDSTQVDVVMHTEPNIPTDDKTETITRPEQGMERSKWLDEPLPMLNNSTRRNAGSMGDAWSGRTVRLSQVLSRWFTFIS